MAGHRVDVVLTGHIGRKALVVLKNSGIKVCIGVSGRVGEAIEKFKAGHYSQD